MVADQIPFILLFPFRTVAKSKQSENVPKAMVEKFDSIVALTDEFARQHLNEEYAGLIRQATAALCRKRPSPLEKGQARTWACGITHAIGMVNFLFDPSQDPHVSASEIYRYFGVADSTGQGKSKLVRDTLKMQQFDPDWWLPSRIDDNPMVWMLSVNGFLMDIRHAPFGAQLEAYRKGLIPYIPGHKEDSEAIAQSIISITPAPTPPSQKNASPPSAKPQTPPSSAALQSVYVLKVALLSGPVTEKFVKKNPHIIRTIEIRGDQTLADLHHMIFQAFGREEEHMYEFQLKGDRPDDPDADRYGLSVTNDPNNPQAGDVVTTQVGALDLEVGEPFGYWFDFGDDWWHQVTVVAITEPQPKVKYPRVTQRIGANPPQYADFD